MEIVEAVAAGIVVEVPAVAVVQEAAATVVLVAVVVVEIAVTARNSSQPLANSN